MAKRAFSRELYEAYDGTAKAALVKILEDEGHEIVAIAENYYADVMSMKDGVPYYSEAEIKRGWTGEIRLLCWVQQVQVRLTLLPPMLLISTLFMLLIKSSSLDLT
jgi:hypothetical protein